MTKLHHRPHDLIGERALVVSVIDTALKDAVSGTKAHRADARRYFAGHEYRRHLEALGLPPSWLPERFEGHGEATKERLLYWLTANNDEARNWRATAPLKEWAANLQTYTKRRNMMESGLVVMNTATGYIITNLAGEPVPTAIDVARLSKSDLFKLALVTLNAMGGDFTSAGIAPPSSEGNEADAVRVNWDAISEALAERVDPSDFATADGAPTANAGGYVEAPMPTTDGVQAHRRAQSELKIHHDAIDVDDAGELQANVNNVPADAIEAPMPAPKGEDS